MSAPEGIRHGKAVHRRRILKLYYEGWGPQKIYKCLRHRLGYKITLEDVCSVVYGKRRA